MSSAAESNQLVSEIKVRREAIRQSKQIKGEERGKETNRRRGEGEREERGPFHVLSARGQVFREK